MTNDPTARLVDRLVADAAPVAPVAPLRVTVGLLMGSGFLVTLLAIVLTDAAWPVSRAGDGTFIGVLLGLVAVACGGSIAGLASTVPGRRAAARAGAAVLAAGVVAGLAATLPGLEAVPSLTALADSAGHCFVAAIGFAVVPVGLGIVLARRAWSLSPFTTVFALLLGTTAFGALAVQLTCPVADPLHVLVGHESVPWVATVLAAPLAVGWIRRYSG